MNLKRVLSIGSIILIAIFIAILAYWFFTTGTITISSNSPKDTVSIAGVNSGNRYSKQAISKLTVRVKRGQYRLSVSNQQAVANKVVSLKARQHLSYTLTPPTPAAPEPVFGHGASSIAADSSQLLFINSRGHLTKIGANNIEQVLDAGHILASSKWNSTSFGVALSKDNVLYAITNGALAEIQLPFSPINSGQGSVGYALAPNGQVYVSNGASIYVGTVNSPFRKIYTAKFSYLRLSASNNRLAIFYTGVGNSEGAGSSHISPSITLIDASGKVVATKNTGALYQAAWSESGKYLLTQNSKAISIYDSSLHLIRSLPVDNSVGIAWISPTEFVYGVGNDLWKSGISNNQSSTIAQLGSGTINELSVDFNGSYVYMESESSAGDNPGVTRIGLKNQRPLNYIQALNVFLPESIGVCSLNYINFTSPTIVASYSDFMTTSDFCVNVAKGELQHNGVDPSKFQYQAQAAPANQGD